MEKITEQWKDVVGYEGIYRVSNLGRVYAIGKQELLKQRLNTAGYPQVNLYDADYKMKSCQVHRLVALAWLPMPAHLINIRAVVDHIDFDRTNNHLENLRWVSYAENQQHTVDAGRNNARKGSDRKDAKLNDGQVLEIRRRYAAGGVTQRILADEFGISQGILNKIILRKRWAHL